MAYLRSLLLFAVLMLVSCTEHKHVVQRGVYYWKTTLNWSSIDSTKAQELGLQRIYLRYFDVALVNKEILPVAPMQVSGAFPSQIKVVPVIYITLDALKSLQDSATADLAKHIVEMVQRMQVANGLPFSDLQIDCDWTVATREKYFHLLQELKKNVPGILSVTIRLHQVKFAHKTGVPPADRGMLMIYNMGNPGNTGYMNSIIEDDLVKSYVMSLNQYPLALDYAYPIFSWVVLFRDDHMMGLIRDVRAGELDTLANLHSTGSNQWVVGNAGYIHNVRIQRGDRLRFDDSDPKTILAIAHFLAQQVKTDSSTSVSFFSWDSTQIHDFGASHLEDLYEIFDKNSR